MPIHGVQGKRWLVQSQFDTQQRPKRSLFTRALSTQRVAVGVTRFTSNFWL
jgi:hypothetical protein